MAVIVDKARGDDAAGGVDRARGRAAQLADLGDLAVFDSDIATERRHPRAVDDPAVLDQQVIRHRYPFPRWNLRSRFFKRKCNTQQHPAAQLEIDGMLFRLRMAGLPSEETIDCR